MVNETFWYPHQLWLWRTTPAAQGPDGHFIIPEGRWDQLTNCRREPSARGSVSLNDNAKMSSRACIIYAPQHAQLPAMGDRIKVQEGGEAYELEVTDIKRFRYNSQIWAQ